MTSWAILSGAFQDGRRMTRQVRPWRPACGPAIRGARLSRPVAMASIDQGCRQEVGEDQQPTADPLWVGQREIPQEGSDRAANLFENLP